MNERDERRLELADAFLREAVYRARAQQAAASSLAFPSPAPGGCGLGERAGVVLDLSDRGREIFVALFGADARATIVDRVHATMKEWVEAQDALDRRRNHFLKGFRQEHGFDRTQYSDETRARYEAGLERINRDEDRERRARAETLIAGD